MKLFISLIMLVFTCSAWPQSYPDKSRPLRIVVPFGAGSSTDMMARGFGRAISEAHGINVIVENKPGAEGVIGMQAVKNAPPDGYTILLANSSTQVLNVHMLAKLPYDPVADYVPISGVAKFTLVLNAGPSLPFKTVRQFVEAAKANPGKYSYGSATASTRLAMEMLEHLAQVKLLAVPYKAMAAATTALASGEVDLLMNDAATAIPFYQTGKVRPLAVTGSARMKALPNVPTLSEEGLSEYELTGWFATYFPANTPPAIVATMRDMIREAAKTRYVADALALSSFEPLDISGAELTALQRTESDKWGKMLRAMGVQAR